MGQVTGGRSGSWHARRVTLRSTRVLVGLLSAALATGCPSGSEPVDGAVALDAGSDARVDANGDAGCTGVPGVLEGERSVDSLDFPFLSWAIPGGEIGLRELHTPCASAGPVIVLRQLAGWSAHARWHARHTAAIAAREDVRVIDLWSEDLDALPARVEQLSTFEAFYDARPHVVAVDPEESLRPLGIAGFPLPAVAILDPRTMRAHRVLLDPRAGEVEAAIESVQAELRGERPPVPPAPALVDGRFTADRWDLVQEMASGVRLPPSPSNAHADDPQAAALGARLFEDAALSPEGVSCARCHEPSRAFTDGLPLGTGVAQVDRNTPTVLGAAAMRWQFWDGRADTLWAQALGPIENAREMASSRLFVAHRVAAAYRAEYEAIFGPLPPLEDASRFPASGLPGEPAWEAMAPEDREAVTRVFVNVGKAIEAFERTLVVPEGRFEAYARGSFDALTSAERDGLAAYFRAGCAQCHDGPLFSNGAFHPIAMPGAGASPDLGRLAAWAPLTTTPFRAQGPYADDPSSGDPLAGLEGFPERTRGAFRTPTLRAIAQTAPYGHAGTFETLRDVVLHYARIRMPRDPDPRVVGLPDPHLVGFEERLVEPIVTFLRAL